MPNFLEKLKKGMNINDLPEATKEEKNKTNQTDNQPPETDFKIDDQGINIKKEKPKKIGKKKMQEEPPKIQEEKPAENIIKEKLGPEMKPNSQKIEIKTGKFEIKKQEAPTENNWLEEEGQLTVDVYQTDKEIVVQSAIAGVKPEDMDILIENDIVIISGCRPKPPEKENQNYFCQECHWGRFCREIVVPEEVDNTKAKAGLNQGILTIRLPKTGRPEKKKLLIEGV